VSTPTPTPRAILGATYTGTSPFPTLDEVKAKLGIDASDTSQDAAITQAVLSTIAIVESYLGRGIANVQDGVQDFEPIDTRDKRLFLSRFPVQAVTSIDVDGSPLSTGSWRVFARQGVIELGDGCCHCFPRHGCERLPLIHVVYTAGYPDDAWPTDLLEAVLIAFYGRWPTVSATPPTPGASAPVRSWTSDGLSVVYADQFVGMGSRQDEDVIPPDLLSVAAILDPYRVRFLRGV